MSVLNSCEHYLELMSAFMDGELDETHREELSEHINTCDDCFNASLAYKSINEAISDGEVSPPEDLCALVMEGIRSSAPAAPKAKKKFTTRHLAALAAAAAVVIITAVAAPSMFKKGASDEALDAAAPEDAKDSLVLDSAVLDGGDADMAPDKGEAETGASKPGGSSFLPDLPGNNTAAPSPATTYTGYDGLMMIGPRPDVSAGEDDNAPAETTKEEDIVLGDPVTIKDYDCSAIIVLDPAIDPPDVFEQYTYYSWVEGSDEYHIVSSDLYDELMGALENLNLSHTLDLFSKMEKDNWVLLITSMKE